MKRIFAVFIFLFFSIVLNTYSQKYTLTGILVDDISNQPLEYATIIITSAASEFPMGCLTNHKGKFKINIPKGSYLFTAKYLSYQSKIIDMKDFNKDTNIGIIKLHLTTETLDPITINATKSKTQLSLDKKTYNVEKDILANGGTAIDVLTNAPSVSVSAQGLPMIRGNTATIMINGRISARSKINALKNLPASSIQKIEVITTPSARYSGDSSGGIVNIILKKGLDNGLNGSVTTTSSVDDSAIYGVATSLNYRFDKLNIYSNTNFYHRKPVATTFIKNEYKNNGLTTGYLNEDRKYTRKNIIFESIIGVDYYFNDYININVEGSYANFNGDFDNLNESTFFDDAKNITSINKRTINTDHKNDIYEIAATYTQYFERENEIVYIEFSHSKDIEVNDSYLSNLDSYPIYSENPDKDELIFDNLTVQNTKWLLAYDWPMTSNVFFEFGYEANLGKATNDFVNEIIVNGSFEPNPLTSNLFKYTENWHRIYTMYNHSFGDFSYRIGLSTEFTNLDVNLVTSNQRSKQKYTDFNPSLNFKYTLSDSKSLSFSYRRGLDRSNYPNLNPFEQRISETSSFVGNKNLLPFYTNGLELNLLNMNNKNSFVFNPTLYFKNYHNIWQYVTYENGDIINGIPKLITTPINLGDLNFLGTELLATYTPAKWVDINGTLDMRYVTTSGTFEYTDSNNQIVVLDYSNDAFGGNTKLNTTFSFKNNLKLQTLLQYEFTSKGAYSTRKAYAFMNASASKDFFNKQLTLSFIADDIFNSNRTKRTRYPNEDVISYNNSQWKESSFLLSLTWRLNQSKKAIDLKFDKKDLEINN